MQLQIAAKLSVLCCHLVNTNKDFDGLATVILPFTKLCLSLICRHETVLVNLKSKPDWLFERNPFGLVPILEHKGNVIYESAVCNEFLEEAFPGSSTGTRDLLPSCPYRRAALRLFMQNFNQVCWHLLCCKFCIL